MPWYAVVLIVYIALDRIFTVAVCGDDYAINITPAFAVLSLISGALIIWAIVSLAGIC